MQNGKHLQQNKQAYIFFLLSLAVGWNYLFHLYLLIGLKKKSVFCLLLSAQSNVYCPGYRDISFFLLIIESVKAVLKNCVPSPQMTQPHILSWRKTTRCQHKHILTHIYTCINAYILNKSENQTRLVLNLYNIHQVILKVVFVLDI